jgi:hypothetical protein
MHGFSREAFGNYATFDAPGAGTSAGQGTRPSTNNLSGAVTGWWVDGNGLNHGFVWYPGGFGGFLSPIARPETRLQN